MEQETIAEGTCAGIGRRERRRMIKRWKEANSGLSLKAWARKQNPVGDGAYIWWRAKGGKEADHAGSRCGAEPRGIAALLACA